MDSSFFASLKNCEGCKQRKEKLTEMLRSHVFWTGIVVGVGATYVWHRYKSK